MSKKSVCHFGGEDGSERDSRALTGGVWVVPRSRWYVFHTVLLRRLPCLVRVKDIINGMDIWT